tara:strand:+ start:425 stop:1327 length:903 start_codon:yes stop_codon:yes gene_type:complete
MITLNFFNQANAKMYRVGTTFEKEIEFSRNFVLPLSEGRWEVVDRYGENISIFYFKGNAIAKVENNELMELIWVERADLKGTHMGVIDSAVNTIIFKDPYDGCYQRPEYYLLEFFKKGGTHNCLVARHLESNKELFAPDDPQSGSAQLKKWLRDNSIIIPPIALGSFHSYFSRLMRGEWYVIQYMANPKLFSSPKINYLTEDSSEFHKANIARFPEHKITMDKWISISAKRHQYLEKLFNAKDHHLLNLSKYILQSDIKDLNNKDSIKNVIEDLKKLNELYKSGILTEEEFKKAKNKILN